MPSAHIAQIRILATAPPLGPEGCLLVELVSQQGESGLGELGFGLLDDIGEIVEALAPVALGRSALDREAVWHAMTTAARDWDGDHTLIAAALSAIDTALWDLSATSLGVSSGVLMGGRTRPALDLCIHCGRATDDAAHKAADSLAHKGIGAFSFDVGAAGKEQLAGLRQARRLLKQQALIAATLSTPASSAEQAIEVGQAIDRLDPYWVGGLLEDGQWAELAKVRGAIASPTGAGASTIGIRGLSRALQAECADLLIPDIALCGGPTGALKLADLAHLAGVRVSLAPGDTLVSALAACHVSLARPNLAPLRLSAALFTMLEQAAGEILRDGFILPPEGPGLGLDEAHCAGGEALVSFASGDGG